MFSIFTHKHPVVSEKIKPDETFLNWLDQMRNPSTDSTLQNAVKADPIATQPSTRETA